MKPRMPDLLTLCCLLLVGPGLPTAADEVVLKSGGRLLGKAFREQGWVRVELESGALTFPESAVEVVIPGPSPAEIKAVERDRRRAWLEMRLGATDPLDAQSLYKIAEEARALDFPAGELHMILGLVLGADADHAGARADLDHLRHDGRWLPRDDARELERRDHAARMRAAGFILYRGEWMRPSEADWHRREARWRNRIAELEDARDRALDERDTALAERDGLLGRISSCEAGLSSAEAEIGGLRGDIHRLECAVSSLEGELGACRSELAAAPREVCAGD